MNYSFPQYLLAKQTVDDRAINRAVLEKLRSELARSISEGSSLLMITEVGAGIGTMLKRLLAWGVLSHGEYTLLDQAGENIGFAREWLARTLPDLRLRTERLDQDLLKVSGDACLLNVRLLEADIFDFVGTSPVKADLLIAHALLDLMPMPGSLSKLFALVKPGGLAWLTLNFDGVTTLAPAIDPVLDDLIERLYHESMDSRASGGGSHCGRQLFAYIQQAGGQILAAGSSDWVVHPSQGAYPDQEADFLQFILHFFEQSLSGHPDLDADQFNSWLARRREQIKRGELFYVTHQMDFLVRM